MIKNILKTIAVIMIIVIIVLFYFIKTFDIYKYKSKIEHELSKATNQSVNIEGISLDISISDGVLLKMQNMKMSGYIDTQMRNELKIGEIILTISVKDYLEDKKIVITEIGLNNPTIEIIKTINREGESKQKDQNSTKKVDSIKADNEVNNKSSANDKIISAVMVEVMNIKNGKIFYRDESVKPYFELNINDITFKTKEFAFNKKFDYELGLSLISAEQNINLQGSALIDNSNSKVSLSDLNLKTNLSKISVKELKKVFPAIEDIGLDKSIYGFFMLNLKNSEIGKNGLEKLDLSGEIVDGKASLSVIEYPIDNIDMQFNVTEKNIKIDQLFMYFASGSVNIKADIDDYVNKQEYSVDLSVEDVNVSEVIGKYVSGIKTQGRMFGNFKGSGQGFDIEKVKNNFYGQGHLNIDKGKILDVNLLRLILEKISIIPNLAKKIEANLSEEDKEKLKAKDTDFEEVKVDIIIQEGIATARNTNVGTRDLVILAGAKCNFEGDLNFRSDLYFKEDLSRIMMQTVSELALLSDKERIRIPMKTYEGKVDRFITYPDIEAIGKILFKEKGKSELRKVIFNALGIDEDQIDQQKQSDQNIDNSDLKKSEDPQEQDKKPEKPSEAIIIDNILDMIFQ
ncbi:MAG: AsmA family protein [Candidatus Omnitrophica bacterium]|nr:AsmA family protein [Candidatus Omnitrophota bacterium]MBU1997672.1 AsmA family protein [Candidatus Omnitrophota bacterium]MBU4333801.1 AsmA family protein [Candidatus Omnitrophota bacterium]